MDAMQCGEAMTAPDLVERCAKAVFGDQYWDDDDRETHADRGRYGPDRTERLERTRLGIAEFLAAIREPEMVERIIPHTDMTAENGWIENERGKVVIDVLDALAREITEETKP
jgi:hypothetical protein